MNGSVLPPWLFLLRIQSLLNKFTRPNSKHLGHGEHSLQNSFPNVPEDLVWAGRHDTPLGPASENSGGRQEGEAAVWHRDLNSICNQKFSRLYIGKRPNNCWNSNSVGKVYFSPSASIVALQCCPEFDLTFLPIHGNRLLENNYLRTSFKTALFFNPISVERAFSWRMIYFSILIYCYITGHILHSWSHQSCSHLNGSAACAHLTEPHLLFILHAISHSCQF